MRVLRIGFLGTRTANVEATVSFFRDVLNLEVRHEDPNWSIFQLPTGRFDFVEVYGSDFDDERLAPSGGTPFVSFVVEDVTAAHEEIRVAGIEAGEIVWAYEVFNNPSYEGFAWFFLRAPDGNIYVVQQTPD